MKRHLVIFEKIKTLLSEHFGEELNQYEEGKHLKIGDSGIWIASDDRELTIGYGMAHNHYDPDYDNLNEAIDRLFNLLTRRKRITEYLKGIFSYKNKTEIELNSSKFEEVGIAMTWFFPFWKRTDKKVTFEDGLIDPIEIQSEIEEIKNYLQIAK